MEFAGVDIGLVDFVCHNDQALLRGRRNHFNASSGERRASRIAGFDNYEALQVRADGLRLRNLDPGVFGVG